MGIFDKLVKAATVVATLSGPVPGKAQMPTTDPRPFETFVTEEGAVTVLQKALENLQPNQIKTGSEIEIVGFESLCKDNVLVCEILSNYDPNISYTERLDLETISSVAILNRQINQLITPGTDLETYGVPEHWEVPYLKGDCEDYVLLKNIKLITGIASADNTSTILKFSPKNLHIFIVKDENGDGHAILGLRLFYQGKMVYLILDNKTSKILPYQEVRKKYIFVAVSDVRLDKTGESASYVLKFRKIID